MSKVLLIGPSFYGYTKSVSRALEKHGCLTKTLEWVIETDIVSRADRLQAALFADRQALVEKRKAAFNETVVRAHSDFGPDFVLVIRGVVLSRETLLLLKSRPVILWMMDSIFLTKNTLDNIDLYSKVFVFEKEDIPVLRDKYAIEAEFLPLALDESVYFPIDTSHKPIDILFVGALYPNRVAMINRIIAKFPGKNIRVYGTYFSIIRNIRRFLFRKDKKYYMNKTVTPEKLNRLYSKTKICLNIHHTQSQYGVNQRFFEIAGSRAFQVCDKHGFIEDNFEKDEVVTFGTEQELHTIIENVLNGRTDTSSQADGLHKKVLQAHTFSNRIERIGYFVPGLFSTV